jgi:uncharacterized membrane protein
MSLRIVVAVVLALVLGTPAAHAVPFFMGLGARPGASSSAASAVSADGSTVVGTSAGEAFRWTAGTGLVSLGTAPGGVATAANDVSGDGSVVVGTAGGIVSGQAFRWTASDGIVPLGALPGVPAQTSEGLGISADGTTIVGESNSVLPDVDNEPFRWTAGGGMVGLGFVNPNPFGDGVSSRATAVSADGSVIVGWTAFLFDDPNRSWRWTSATGLVHNTGPDRRPEDLSSDATLEVGIWNDGDMDSPHEAYLWSAVSGLVPLGDLPWDGDPFDEPEDTDSGARAVSDAGVVVGFGQQAAGDTAFIWDAVNGMRPLAQVLEDEYGFDLTGWRLIDATDITADGRTIVGRGIAPNGTTQAWIAFLPEPGSLGLLALGFAGLAARRAPRTPRRRACAGRSSGGATH